MAEQEKLETAGPQTTTLVTGHFREGAKYTAWRPRGTGDWLLIATLSGFGRFGFDGGEVYTSAGGITLLRPGTRHDYGTLNNNWELLWVHFHAEPAWQTLLAWPEAGPGLMHLTLAETAMQEKVFSRLFDMHHLATGALSRRETFAMNALEEALLWCDTQNPGSDARLDRRVQAVMDFLCRRLEESVNLSEAAAESGLSVSRLSHLFREQTGSTPLQFLERQRLDRACKLLDFTRRPITAIAAEVGFENPFYFTLRFKRFTGYSPRDYRNRLTTSK